MGPDCCTPADAEALREHIKQRVRETGAQAMRTISDIQDPALRDDSLVKFFRYWRKQDTVAAKTWLESAAAPQIRERVARR